MVRSSVVGIPGGDSWKAKIDGIPVGTREKMGLKTA